LAREIVAKLVEIARTITAYVTPSTSNNEIKLRMTRWSPIATAKYRWRSAFEIRTPPAMAESSAIQVSSGQTRSYDSAHPCCTDHFRFGEEAFRYANRPVA